MSINKCKIIGVLLLTFCIGFFVNIDGVKAVTDGDGSGYAICEYYHYDDDFTPAGSFETVPGRFTRINIYFYKTGDSPTSYKSYASIRCTEPTEDYSYLYADRCTINNYDDIFHNASEYQSFFKEFDDYQNHTDPKWTCPSSIYVDKTINDREIDGLYLRSDDCPFYKSCSSWSLANSTISQDGMPPDTEEEGSMWVDETTRQPITVRPDGTESSTIDTQYIKNWGDEAYNNNEENWEVGDSCRVIEGNEWLSSILNFIFWVLVIAGIILVILLTIFDFIKVITGNDDDGIKKAFGRFIRRVVVAVLLILLPLLISIIVNLINNNSITEDEIGEDGVVKIGSDGGLYCDVIDDGQSGN